MSPFFMPGFSPAFRLLYNARGSEGAVYAALRALQAEVCRRLTPLSFSRAYFRRDAFLLFLHIFLFLRLRQHARHQPLPALLLCNISAAMPRPFRLFMSAWLALHERFQRPERANEVTRRTRRSASATTPPAAPRTARRTPDAAKDGSCAMFAGAARRTRACRYSRLPRRVALRSYCIQKCRAFFRRSSVAR